MRPHPRRSPDPALRGRLLLALTGLLAALLSGLAILLHGAVRSAILVDSLLTENTVRTVELGAAWDAMLLGLVISIVSAAAAAGLVVSAHRRRTSSQK